MRTVYTPLIQLILIRTLARNTYDTAYLCVNEHDTSQSFHDINGDMAISWVLPARGAQALLSLTVLGLMSYGTLTLHTHPPRTTTNTSHSLTMVVHPLAPILPRGSKLPHLRALLVPPRARLPHYRPPKILAQTVLHSRKIWVTRSRRLDHVILVWGLHCTRSVSER